MHASEYFYNQFERVTSMKSFVSLFVVLLYLTSLNGQVNLDSLLVAHYPFNGSADDVSDNLHHATVFGAVLAPDRFGQIGNAYLFDGEDDYVIVWNQAESNDNLNTNEGAVSAWFFQTSREPSESAFIFQYYSGNSDRLYADVGDHLSPNNRMRFGVGNGFVLSKAQTATEQWYHVVCMWAADSSTILYINGIADTTGYYSNPGFEFQADENFYFGRGWDENAGYYAGVIDDIRIYNRTLTIDEIQYLYGEGGWVSLGNDDHSRQPSRFALKQNFPNPFNPKTRIEYTLLTSGKVKLEVFNALGQLVTVLVSEEQTAGVRQVDFDGSQLASGVYYYRLSAAGKSQTLKMILVK
jgi:hypothetical protein